MRIVDPIVALAGATASQGNRLFADELLRASNGKRSIEQIVDRNRHLSGMLSVHVAQVAERNSSALK